MNRVCSTDKIGLSAFYARKKRWHFHWLVADESRVKRVLDQNFHIFQEVMVIFADVPRMDHLQFTCASRIIHGWNAHGSRMKHVYDGWSTDETRMTHSWIAFGSRMEHVWFTYETRISCIFICYLKHACISNSNEKI